MPFWLEGAPSCIQHMKHLAVLTQGMFSCLYGWSHLIFSYIDRPLSHLHNKQVSSWDDRIWIGPFCGSSSDSESWSSEAVWQTLVKDRCEIIPGLWPWLDTSPRYWRFIERFAETALLLTRANPQGTPDNVAWKRSCNTHFIPSSHL